MDKLKPKEVKIINLSILPPIVLNTRIEIFGLGDDNIVYQWNASDAVWNRYASR